MHLNSLKEKGVFLNSLINGIAAKRAITELFHSHALGNDPKLTN